MKSGSDNFRKSAIIDIMNRAREYGFKVYVYEPTIEEFDGFDVVKNLVDFKKKSTVILANRFSPELEDVKDKVYTRDVFNNN